MKVLKLGITNLYSVLQREKILKHIRKENNFNDEPQMYRFSVGLNSTKKFSDGHPNESNAGGFSFFSKKLALLKCLVEAAERFCTMCYREKDTIVSSYYKLKQPALNPALFPRVKPDRKTNFRWTKGVNLSTGQPVLIPTQLIYYNYHFLTNEPLLTELNSTGAAGGFEYDMTVLRAIYEVVERDAFMTMYLAKLPCPQVDLVKINNPKIEKIRLSAKRYNLEIKVFDITNDLGIPSFMALVLDRTGLGPVFSIGLKSSFDPLVGISGSMEEAFHTRPGARRSISENKSNFFKIKPEEINSIKDRSLYWLSPTMLNKLGFLLDKAITPSQSKIHKLSAPEELKMVMKIISDKNFHIYFMDTTIKQLKKSGFFSCKIIIPELQPLYLHERTREVRIDRLKSAALCHGIQEVEVNPIPHPFL